MEGTLLKLAIAGVLSAHGIGHALGWLPAAGLARFEGTSGSSWLLSGVVGDAASRALAVGLFAVPTVGFVAAAVGLLLGQPWWRPVAVASATASLAATAVYPQAFPVSSTIGSLAVDGLVLYGILVAGWGATATA
jgi:hypothetical protein